MKIVYQTNLPHIQPIGEVFFVTFRLVDSLPAEVLQKLQDDYAYKQKEIHKSKNPNLKQLLNDERKRYFSTFDSQLDTTNYGNHWLKLPEIAKIVSQKLHEFDKVYYDLYAYTIMSNHVHILVDFGKQTDNLPIELLDEVAINENKLATFDIHYKPLYKVMNLIKGASARYANLQLQRIGTFWQRDNYDYYVRNGKELNNILAYIINNPVKAGLVENWQDFPFTYLANM